MEKTIATPEEKLRKGLRNLAWALLIFFGVLILMFAWSRTSHFGHAFAGKLFWMFLALLFPSIFQWFFLKRYGLAVIATKQRQYRFFGWSAVGFGALWLMSCLLARLLPLWRSTLMGIGQVFICGGIGEFMFWFGYKFMDLSPTPSDNKNQDRQA